MNDMLSGLVIFLAIIFCIIIYLISVNILKLILSFHFISKLVNDFRKANKKYLKSDENKKWAPWKYK